MGDWANSSEISRLENQFHAISGGKNFLVSGEEYYLSLKCENDFLLAFNSCPPLKAIIGKRSKAFNTGDIQIRNKNTNNLAKGPEAKAFNDLMKKPNALQTGRQFMSQQNHYVDIFGYCPVLKIGPAGIPDEITALWNIPPWLFGINYTGKWLEQFEIKGIYKEYFMTWDGKRKPLEFDDLGFIFDDGVGTENDTNLTIPDSRLIGLEYPVSNTIAAYKSRNTLITKRGAIGILSNDAHDAAGTIRMKPDDKEAVQEDFRRYGITGQPYQVIVTNAALKWQQMGFPTKDLLLFEEISANIDAMCDGYGYPVELMSRDKGTTFNNKKEASKMLYRDTIIPEAESRVQQLGNIIFNGESRFEVCVDFSQVEVLQEDDKNKSEARKALNEARKIEYENGLITKNDWREALGMDRLTEPGFDDYKEIKTPPTETPGADPLNIGANGQNKTV